MQILIFGLNQHKDLQIVEERNVDYNLFFYIRTLNTVLQMLTKLGLQPLYSVPLFRLTYNRIAVHTR